MLDGQMDCHKITKRKNIHKDELNRYLTEGWSLIKITVGNERPYTIGWDETGGTHPHE